MEKVVILSNEEFKALNDNITDLSARVAFAEALNLQYKNNKAVSTSRYFSARGVEVSADEYINGLLNQIDELTREESYKDTLYCEQRDLVQRLRDDLANQADFIDQLERRNSDIEEALSTICYEANAVL